MGQDAREDLLDLLPKNPTLWADDEEIGRGCGGDYAYWAEILGHPKAHPGCCKTCGCAITCTLAAFYDAMEATLLRELDRIGALRSSAEVIASRDELATNPSATVEKTGKERSL
jgi:hypothetical protein